MSAAGAGVRPARPPTGAEYRSTMRVSTTRHSRLAKYSSISGAPTDAAGLALRPNFLNLSIFAPLVLPHLTTLSAMLTEGMLRVHSRDAVRRSNE